MNTTIDIKQRMMLQSKTPKLKGGIDTGLLGLGVGVKIKNKGKK